MSESLTTQIEAKSPLPDFESPPVIEVVYGAQFKPLGLQSPSIGLFWQSIRNRYPKFEEMPVLEPVIERFGPDQKIQQVQVSLLPRPPIPRLFFIDESKHWVLQLQGDRLMHNWRKVEGEGAYPRYAKASSRFFDAWDSLLTFCDREHFSMPVVDQLELTYINHISVTDNSDPFKEANIVFPDIRWQQRHEFLPQPETLFWKTAFILPDRMGRLHVSLRHASRRKDNWPVLLFELTARGMPPDGSLASIKDWFDLSHQWIVRGFSDLTDQQIQKERWGKRT